MIEQPKDYKPTCYEQVVIDVMNGKDVKWKDFAFEFKKRSHTQKDFQAYLEHVNYAVSLVRGENFNLRQAVQQAKTNNPVKNKILKFQFTDEEKQLILKAEDMGRIKSGEVVKYEGYDREVRGVSLNKIPQDTDAFVVFSGHPGAAEPALKAWLYDIKRTGNPKKLVFLGLHDNQSNTDFTDTSLKFNVVSETEMYRRYFAAAGVSQEIIDECIIEPTDISTEENIAVLAEVRNKYFGSKDDVKFLMFGYPAYQKRIASEFAYGFQKLEDEGKVSGVNFYIPNMNVSHDERKRYLSYDNLDTIAADIVIGNCMAHPYRVYAGGRFDSGLGKYPDEFKPILPLSLVYSYPNVANELAGTNTEVAAVLKILRGVQHETYEFEKAKAVDNTIVSNILYAKRDVALHGLVSSELMEHGNKMSKADYIDALKAYQKEEHKNVYREGAKVLLGSKTNSSIVETVANFLKKSHEK